MPPPHALRPKLYDPKPEPKVTLGMALLKIGLAFSIWASGLTLSTCALQEKWDNPWVPFLGLFGAFFLFLGALLHDHRYWFRHTYQLRSPRKKTWY